MFPSFSTMQYAELLDLMVQMEKWLKERRTAIEKTRFEKTLHIVENIVQYANSDRIQEVVNKHGHVIVWTALSEASMYTGVFNKIKMHSRVPLRLRTIRAITNGPFHSWDEESDGSSIHGRNFLFELETAAKFTVPGIKVIDYDDVDFVINGIKVNVQCKRFQSISRIEANINTAVGQIQAKIGHNLKHRGLIALNIDKIVGIESLYFPTRFTESFSQRLDDLVDSFRLNYSHLWQHLIDTRIIGVLIFVHGLCIYERDDGTDMIVTGRQIMMDIIPKRTASQINDCLLAEKIGQKLQDTL